MNKTQKLILAFFVPIIFFFIALFIIKEIDHTFGLLPVITSKVGRYSTAVNYRNNDFLNFLGGTWYVWLLYSASCCLFEFLLFRNNKKI